jgi:periplasmic protein TonB
MRMRGWIALTLCAGALGWTLADAASAGQPATPGRALDATEVAATRAREASKDTADFSIVDEIPKVLKQVPPKYPDEARKHGVQGLVQVRALVKKDGLTAEVSVAPGKGVSPELDRAAVEAVQQWVFSPARAKGKPVAVWVVVPVKFSLR